MNEPKRYSLLKFFAIAFVLGGMFIDFSHADGCKGNCPDGGDVRVDTDISLTGGDIDITGGDVIGGDVSNVLTGGDVTNTLTGGALNSSNSVNVQGSRSYGLSTALGDVDINQCVFSIQRSILFVGWQNIDYNLWCMGESYDAKGLLYMGALTRCDIKPIRAHFNTDAECIQANTITLKKEPDNFNLDAKIKEDERYDAMYADFQAFKAESDQRVAQAEKVAQRANTEVQSMVQAVQTVDDAMQRRAMARAALKGEE